MRIKDEEALRVAYNVYAKEIVDRRMIVPAAAVADSVELVRPSGTHIRKRPEEIYDNSFRQQLGEKRLSQRAVGQRAVSAATITCAATMSSPRSRNSYSQRLS